MAKDDKSDVNKLGEEHARRLHEYWARGEGSTRIAWGTDGDFDRCVTLLGRFVADPKGYCAKMHHEVLGIWPATHAKIDRAAKSAAKHV